LDDLVDTSNKNTKTREQLSKLISSASNNQRNKNFEEFRNIDSNLIPRQDIIDEFLKGQLSDLDFKQPKDLSQLLKYCYRVAGVVGLMICDVLGIHDAKLRYFAIDFGIAMQLTNICRDINEDAQIDRIYLPKNETASLKINNFKNPSKTDLMIINSTRDKLIKLADSYYESGVFGINQLPKKIKRSFMVASNIYQGIGHKIIQKKISFNEQRVFLKNYEKLKLTIKTLLKLSKDFDIPLHERKLHASLGNLPDTNF
jgi:phytoene synthase